MRHKVWAFYLKNGSIEIRLRVKPSRTGLGKARLSTKEEIMAANPFDSWYGKGTVLKVVPEVEEKKSEICPRNAHHHHLVPGECPFCGAPHGGYYRNLLTRKG